MMSKKIAIGSDHAGFEYKQSLIAMLNEEGYAVQDFGPDSDASVDYPDYVHPLATSIEKQENDLGILICGSANGVAITANKHQGVRAAICWLDEIAALSRQHNDANIICIPARFIGLKLTKTIVATFLNTEFEGGRHAVRVSKIACK